MLLCPFGCVSQKKHPNVILIVVDTLRADHLSCFGYHRPTTPNIDRFAADSVFFTNAIAPAPWTAPSLGSLFTSQYPAVLGYEDLPSPINKRFLTLAEVFKNSGYDTKGIISHVIISSRLNFDQGFDSYDEENARGHGHVSSPSVTDKAISFLEDQKDGKFFLFLHYFDPHYDFIQHEDYNYYPDYDGPLFSRQPLVEEIRRLAPSLSPEDIDYLRALYDSEISFTDEHLGRLFHKLKEMDLYDDSLIVFTADHGEEFCEREGCWIGHTRTLYQELIHVPLIIKLPGKAKKRLSQDYVGLIDIMPTIVDYAGLETPDDYECEGEIIDLPRGKRRNNKAIFSETKRLANLQAVIKDGWKLIVNTDNREVKLYNFENDPTEKENKAGTEQANLFAFQDTLREWYRHINQKKNRLKLEKEDADLTSEQVEILRSLGYIK